ncbi:2-oxo-tetronate isomerase [Candidimonas nitroreducens]|uniref:Hydroxypyruvate isomerase n=1 Tax=Candidimonas nitroreducens TaxID=683354 RepID=A0A225M868_9BURK|nr:2-oxo-tetronate isomerase [Candidimonas nitroreducens]OWT57535.1 hydroxypyruvate isomerase [Candidimonas nitroreducens]
MLKFAANLSFLYNDADFLDRFSAASRDEFHAVEYLFPYPWDARDIAARLNDNGLEQVLFNAPAGDWDQGDRGIACIPGRELEFRAGFNKALEYAQALDCRRVHVMAGICPPGIDAAQMRATYEANVAWAAELAAPIGREVLIEPINHRDMPGYFLNTQTQAHDIVQTVGAMNLKVQMDLYHCQITEGDLSTAISRWIATGRVGHFQIASVPSRNEPTTGEINDNYIFDLIASESQQHGWEGWIGCEYRPKLGAEAGATSRGLTWLRTLRSHSTYPVI